ncbi:hypothetical protein [Lonsdalea britannica]|uniref:hypothetical protein n=2 Tax=Lonsdalea britannica TaxID=1082704 RepID=UPI000B8CCD85|nr:hypothetical protein [Lonsdalea britannica]
MTSSKPGGCPFMPYAVSVISYSPTPSLCGKTTIRPAIDALLYFSLGAGGVLGIYAGLYILSAVLTPFLKTPDELALRSAMKNKAA